MNRMSALLLALSLHLSAFAGEFNETGGAAIRGYDAVAYFTEQKAVKGSAEFSADYKGSKFLFSDAAHRDAFAADPEKYAPQYRGYCAFGVSRGYKADTDPDSFTVVDGKLYLNYNGEAKTMWSKDIPGYLKKSEEKWPEVEKTSKVLR